MADLSPSDKAEVREVVDELLSPRSNEDDDAESVRSSVRSSDRDSDVSDNEDEYTPSAPEPVSADSAAAPTPPAPRTQQPARAPVPVPQYNEPDSPISSRSSSRRSSDASDDYNQVGAYAMYGSPLPGGAMPTPITPEYKSEEKKGQEGPHFLGHTAASARRHKVPVKEQHVHRSPGRRAQVKVLHQWQRGFTLKKLREVAHVRSPPSQAVLVWRAVCILLDKKPTMIDSPTIRGVSFRRVPVRGVHGPARNAQSPNKKPSYWRAARELLEDPQTLWMRLNTIDFETLRPDQISRVRKLLERGEFALGVGTIESLPLTRNLIQWTREVVERYDKHVRKYGVPNARPGTAAVGTASPGGASAGPGSPAAHAGSPARPTTAPSAPGSPGQAGSGGISSLQFVSSLANLQLQPPALSPLAVLNDDTIRLILSSLSGKDLASFALSCRWGASMVYSRTLWHEKEMRLSNEHKELSTRLRDAEERVRGAAPPLHLVESVVSSLNTVSKDDIQEIRVLRNPPAPVRHLLKAVVTLLGHRAETWTEISQSIQNRDFARRIVEFNKDRVPPARVRRVAELLNRSDLTVENLTHVSRASVCLLNWAHGITVYANIHAGHRKHGDALDRVRKDYDVCQQRLETARYYRTHLGETAAPATPVSNGALARAYESDGSSAEEY